MTRYGFIGTGSMGSMLVRKFTGTGMIAPADIDIMQVIDEPDAIVEAIFRFYESRGFSPSASEREEMLYL